MHSFRSSCGLLLEMTISLSDSPRFSLIFTSFRAAFICIMVFEVLSFFFVILAHTQSHPSVKCSVVNSTDMRCPILSHSCWCIPTISTIPTIPPITFRVNGLWPAHYGGENECFVLNRIQSKTCQLIIIISCIAFMLL